MEKFNCFQFANAGINATSSTSTSQEATRENEKTSVNKSQVIYPAAFKRWTNDQKLQLEEMYQLYLEGNMTIKQIATELGRSERSVLMQLVKQVKKMSNYNIESIGLTTVNPSDIPDEQLGDYLNKIEVLEKWIKDVKKYALEQTLENGIYIDGYEIKTTTHNSFDDGTNALNFIKEKFPQYYDRCVQIKGYDYILNHIKDEEFMEALADYTTPKERNKLIKSKSNDID